MIDELLRQQLRDILQATDKELQLKYRNELLKILVPLRIEAVTKSLTLTQTTVKHVVELVDPDNLNTQNQV
jgi:hypothetical protein